MHLFSSFQCFFNELTLMVVWPLKMLVSGNFGFTQGWIRLLISFKFRSQILLFSGTWLSEKYLLSSEHGRRLSIFASHCYRAWNPRMGGKDLCFVRSSFWCCCWCCCCCEEVEMSQNIPSNGKKKFSTCHVGWHFFATRS